MDGRLLFHNLTFFFFLKFRKVRSEFDIDDEVLVDVIRKNNSLSYEELRFKLGTKQYNIIKKKKSGKFDFRG